MGDRVTRAVLEAEVRGFIADMERAGHAASDVGRVVESSAKRATRAQREQSTAAKQVAREQAEAARKGRAAFDETAQTAARGAIAVGAAIGLMGKAAVDWESSWAGVTKSVDGAGEQMEAQLRGLAKTLPATHDEIAAVAEAAGQLGVKSADVVGFTETMVKLGETTNLTADEAATTIAQISNVMGTMNRLGTDGIDRFANVELRMVTEVRAFHAKGYLFHRSQAGPENYTMVIGSSNMTANALTHNQEWNVFFTSAENGSLIRQTKEEFDALWDTAEVVDEAWIQAYESVYTHNKPKRQSVYVPFHKIIT